MVPGISACFNPILDENCHARLELGVVGSIGRRIEPPGLEVSLCRGKTLARLAQVRFRLRHHECYAGRGAADCVSRTASASAPGSVTGAEHIVPKHA